MICFLFLLLGFLGCTPSILDASARGDVKQMEILLKESPDRVNYTDDLGKSAIHLSAVHNRLDSMQYLIELQADLNVQDGTGQTVLHIAAAGDHFHLLRALIQAGADVTSTDDFGDTALHSAALHNSERVVKELLKAGFDIDQTNVEGLSPLDLAQQFSDYEVVAILADIVKEQ